LSNVYKNKVWWTTSLSALTSSKLSFVQEEGIIRISASCYMLNQSKASNNYYYYHSVIQQTVLLQEITNQFCVYINIEITEHN